jgi:hypothetical protein
MIILKQSDPRWGALKIGNSNLTIGGYGCLITSISMLSDWYGMFRDPAWMAKYLSFTPGGLLLWQSVTASKLPLKFVYRYYSRDDAKIKSILLSKDGSCVLQVKYGTGYHWVVLVGYSKLYGYKIADPIDGKIKWNPYKEITGFAEFTRK